MKLLTIKEAATATGLKECELRLGAKQGRYPYILSLIHISEPTRP